LAESFRLLSAMERFIRNEDDSWVMRMRLIYNGAELTSNTGVPHRAKSQSPLAYPTQRRLASLSLLRLLGGLATLVLVLEL